MPDIVLSSSIVTVSDTARDCGEHEDSAAVWTTAHIPLQIHLSSFPLLQVTFHISEKEDQT